MFSRVREVPYSTSASVSEKEGDGLAAKTMGDGAAEGREFIDDDVVV